MKGTIRDRAVHARYRAVNWAAIGMMGLKNGPLRLLRQMRRYPWLRNMMKANNILDMAVATRTGLYRQASAFAVSNVIASIMDMVEDLLDEPGNTVFHEDLVPPEILYGMGLSPWMVELLGIVMPMIDGASMEAYIDVAETEGIPPDVCSLPKSTMGLFLKGELPRPAAMVASNMPCDGGMTSYYLMEKNIGAPTFHLDVPYDFYSERSVDYFTGELKRLIVWLEEHTPGRMDWDRMREVCEERNRTMELELELWDMIRAKPAPMAAESVYLTYLMYGIAEPGKPGGRGTKVMKRVLEFARKISESGAGALQEERYRVVLWNPPTLIYQGLFAWAEQAYGVALIMDMLTYNRHPFIDTATPESMLRSMARIVMQGPMARHTRGPAENFFGDLFHIVEHFSLDMIWMAGHIGCKNTQALSGMFREKCRERGIPLLNINYDLSDTRIVSPAGIREQVELFMETVMKAERLNG